MTRAIGLIAGTDSSGGAGIGADQTTITDHQCIDFSVVSAITFQNSVTQPKIYPVPHNGLRSQLNDLLQEKIDSIKIGMLPDIEAVEAVEQFLSLIECDKVILDPVKSTSSGYKLISNDGWKAMVDRIIPKVQLVTPNIPEALALLDMNQNTVMDHLELAEKCLKLGSNSILLKGGHFPDPKTSTDILVSEGQSPSKFRYERMQGGSEVRGTGCRLTSAIACNWAKEQELHEAVENAGKYVQEYIKNSLPTDQELF